MLAPIGWDEAFGRIAAGFRLAQRKYGREAVGVFGGGSLTNEKVYLLGKFARVVLRTPHIDYNGRFCMSSAAAAGLRAFGLDRGLPFPVSDIAGADAILLVGANVAETMPPIMQYFDAQRRAGGQLIVVDPRRTSTAEQATMHLRLVPGTDAILAHGLLHVLIHERLIDEAYIRERTEGFEAVRAHAASYWPERVERLTGVPQRDIVAAARTLGLAGNALILTARGAEQQSQGVANVLSFINLALAMGRVGRPYNGYGCLTGQGNGQGGREHGQKSDQLPGYRRLDDAGAREEMARLWGIPPEDLPGPGRSAYELLDTLGRDRGVRGLLVMGSNPVVSAPNATHIEERLASLDFLVVCDFFLSETARLADVVLPSAQWAEEDGTMTNLEGRVLRRRQVLAPPPGRADRPRDPPRPRPRAGFAAGVPGVGPGRVPRAAAGHCRRAGRLLGHHAGAHRSRARRLLAVRRRLRPRDAAALRRSVSDRRTAARVSTASTLRARREAGRRVPVLSHDRPRPGAVPVGNADAPRAPAALPPAWPRPRCIRGRRSGPASSTAHEITIETRRGRASFRLKTTAAIREDTIFVPFHWPEEQSANRLTNDALDPISRMPEFKVCAARVAVSAGGAESR